MRRWLIVGFLVAIFAAAAALGFAAASRLAPVYLEAALEEGLSEALATPVRLERTELRRGESWPFLRLEIRRASAWPGARGPGLAVERVHAEVDLLAWLRGRTPVDRVVLEAPWLRLPPGGERPPDPAVAATDLDLLQQRVASLTGVGEWLRETVCELPAIDVLGGRLQAAAAPGDPPVELRDIQGSLACDGGGGRIGLSAEPPSGGRVEVHVDVVGGEVRAEVSLDRVEAADWAPLTAPARAKGRLSGRLGWRTAPGAPHRLEAALRGPRLGIRVEPERGEPWRLDLPAPALHLELRATREALELVHGEWDDRGLTVGADGRLALPVRDGSAVRLALAARDLALDAPLRDRVAELPPEVRGPLEFVLGRLESGRLPRVRLETRTTVGGWNDLLSGRLFARPGAVTLDLSLEEATLRVGETDRMEQVAVEASFRGDVLELKALEAHFRGDPLPAISGRVSGLSHIRSSDELQCITPFDVPALPGIASTRDWVRSRRDEPDASTWQRFRLEADWLAHPALLCTLEQLVAEIRPAPGGVDLDLERGVWAGLPLAAQVAFREGAPDAWHDGRVRVDVEVGPPFEPMQPAAPRRAWLRGRLDAEATRLGDWHIRGGEARFAARGSRLFLEGARIELAPRGEVRGRAELELGHEGRVLYDGGLALEGIPIADLWRAADLGDVALTGSLHGAIHVEGELLRDHPPLASARGHYTLQARDGTLHRKLPLMLAITVASDRWNPFGSRDRIAYEAIDLTGTVAEGSLRSDVLTVEAPTFRMGASGELGVEGPHPLQGVLGIFFFPALDRVIDRLPLVNRVLLGRNRNLVGAYFALDGEAGDPRARIIPVKSITAVGPASFVLEGLPGFVWGGIQRIQAVLVPRAADGPKDRAAERQDS